METKEKNLEQDIENWLLNEGGYVKGTMATYDKILFQSTTNTTILFGLW